MDIKNNLLIIAVLLQTSCYVKVKDELVDCRVVDNADMATFDSYDHFLSKEWSVNHGLIQLRVEVISGYVRLYDILFDEVGLVFAKKITIKKKGGGFIGVHNIREKYESVAAPVILDTATVNYLKELIDSKEIFKMKSIGKCYSDIDYDVPRDDVFWDGGLITFHIKTVDKENTFSISRPYIYKYDSINHSRLVSMFKDL